MGTYNSYNCNFLNSSIPGVYSLEVTNNDYPMPIGILWYRWVGNSTIEILYSFVIDSLRRNGVRTFMHEKLIEEYKPIVHKIITASSNKYSKPWLIKNGFKKEKNGDWIYNIKN